MEYSDRRLDYTSLVVQGFIYIFGVTIKHSLAQASLTYVAGVRKERELGRETTCEGGVIPCLSRAPHALSRAQIPPSPSPFNACHAG